MKLILKLANEFIQLTNIHRIEMNPNYDDPFLVNGSHLTYSYEFIDQSKNLKYIFKGFHQDGLFVIVIDTYHLDLMTTNELKEVYMIPMEWKMKETPNHIMVWDIDVGMEKKTGICYKMNIRKRFRNIPKLKEWIENEDDDKIDKISIQYFHYVENKTKSKSKSKREMVYNFLWERLGVGMRR